MSEPNLTPVFYGNVTLEKGQPKINLEKREAFSNLLRSLCDQPIELTMKKRRKQRSLPQNAYFHGIVLPMIAEACGYSRSELQEVKDGLKARFLRTEHSSGAGIETYRKMAGQMLQILRRTARAQLTAEDAIQELTTELTSVMNDDDPAKLHIVCSTADLSTTEFQTFIEDCRRWAAEAYHLNIPDPDQARL